VSTLEFGVKLPNERYVERPGVYAIMIRDGKLAVINANGKYFLPGGGIETGESETEALHRELDEECDWKIIRLAKLYSAVQYLFAEGEGYYTLRNSFYNVECDTINVRQGTEWLDVEHATSLLHRECDVWAVRQA
jgi:8-oxo-dGTP diphosphatase